MKPQDRPTPSEIPVPEGSVARITEPVIRRDSRSWVYEWTVLLDVPGRDPITVASAWFRTGQAIRPLSGGSNAALIGSILPLMKLGVPVVVEGTVSPLLLRQLHNFQATFASWYPVLRPVAVTVSRPQNTNAPEPNGEVGGRSPAVMFSLGVNSWHSILRHRESGAQLIYIDGFGPGQIVGRGEMRQAAGEAARAVGLPLVIVESNLRDWLERWLDWSVVHGSMIGATLMLLEGQVDKALIPAVVRTWEPVANGSNPFTDPLYSTEHLRTFIDGGDIHWSGKLARLLEQEVVMDRLRVCSLGAPAGTNCGRCPKCVLTMAALHLLGGLERARLFPGRVTPEMALQLPQAPGWHRDLQALLDLATSLDMEQDPVAEALARRFRRDRVERMMASGTLGRMTDPAEWKRLAKLDREGFAADLMAHAPDLVTRTLAPGVDKVPREVFNSLWDHDPEWVKFQMSRMTQDCIPATRAHE